MESIIIEIRAAEGGEDAKLLVGDMTKIYTKLASYLGFKSEIKQQSAGFTVI